MFEVDFLLTNIVTVSVKNKSIIEGHVQNSGTILTISPWRTDSSVNPTCRCWM